MVSIEQGKEAGLSTSGTLHTAETNVIARTLEVAQVPEEFLHQPNDMSKQSQ